MAEKADVRVKCQYCGKTLTNEQAMEEEHGSYCQSLRDKGWDKERMAEHRASMTVTEIPIVEEGEFKDRPWVKLATFKITCPKNNVPVSRIVRAIGGDRCIDPPIRPEYQVVYVGRARYVHPWAASAESFEFLSGLGSASKAVESSLVDGKPTKAKTKKVTRRKEQISDQLAKA